MDIQEQFNLVATEYDSNRMKFIPCFDDYYISSTDFVAKTLKQKPKLIFDLGSGTGLLASFYYKYFPNSTYVLADIADGMLEIAKKRFSNAENVKYEILDYSQKLPDGRPDLVISALSIHHIEHDSKKMLFRNIYDSLNEKGVFVNYDQFCSESKEINEAIEDDWISEIKSSGLSEIEYNRWLERKELDRECSIFQEMTWLKEAGFRNVDLIYDKGKFAVIVSNK